MVEPVRPSQWVDISKFPEGERPHIIAMAKSLNAISEDVDHISGSTPEAKAEMHALFNKGLQVMNWLHSRRFNFTLGGFQVCLVVFTFKQLGLKPEQFARLMDALIKLLEKFGG
jgi:hypothetical protein